MDPSSSAGAQCLDLRPRHPAALHRAGQANQDAYVDSFNGRFRHECLNEHRFLSLPHARQIIAAWRVDYNASGPTVPSATCPHGVRAVHS